MKIENRKNAFRYCSNLVFGNKKTTEKYDLNFVLSALRDDVFERETKIEELKQASENSNFNEEQDFDVVDEDIIAGGAFGHPYSGRPGTYSSDDFNKKISLIEWLLLPTNERKAIPRPISLIGKIISLGDNDFDDEVAKYHSQIISKAMDSAENILNTQGPISIPIGDLNSDGITDSIVSGINRAIDITGDGQVDVIGTLIDITGDGKPDVILDQTGKIINIAGKTAEVIGDSNIKLEDLAQLPKVLLLLLKGAE